MEQEDFTKRMIFMCDESFSIPGQWTIGTKDVGEAETQRLVNSLLSLFPVWEEWPAEDLTASVWMCPPMRCVVSLADGEATLCCYHDEERWKERVELISRVYDPVTLARIHTPDGSVLKVTRERYEVSQ